MQHVQLSLIEKNTAIAVLKLDLKECFWSELSNFAALSQPLKYQILCTNLQGHKKGCILYVHIICAEQNFVIRRIWGCFLCQWYFFIYFLKVMMCTCRFEQMCSFSNLWHSKLVAKLKPQQFVIKLHIKPSIWMVIIFIIYSISITLLQYSIKTNRLMNTFIENDKRSRPLKRLWRRPIQQCFIPVIILITKLQPYHSICCQTPSATPLQTNGPKWGQNVHDYNIGALP